MNRFSIKELSNLSDSQLDKLGADIKGEKINREVRALSAASSLSIAEYFRSIGRTCREFEKSLEAVSKITERLNYIDSVSLLCVEDKTDIIDMMDEAVEYSSLSYKDIDDAVKYFSKGKTIRLKKILPKFIAMRNNGVKAAACGNILAKYYRELDRYGLKVGIVKDRRSGVSLNEFRNKTLDFSKLGFTTEQMTEMTTGSKTKKQLKKENKLLAKELMIANDDFHKVINELNVLKLKIKELNK